MSLVVGDPTVQLNRSIDVPRLMLHLFRVTTVSPIAIRGSNGAADTVALEENAYMCPRRFRQLLCATVPDGSPLKESRYRVRTCDGM